MALQLQLPWSPLFRYQLSLIFFVCQQEHHKPKFLLFCLISCDNWEFVWWAGSAATHKNLWWVFFLQGLKNIKNIRWIKGNLKILYSFYVMWKIKLRWNGCYTIFQGRDAFPFIQTDPKQFLVTSGWWRHANLYQSLLAPSHCLALKTHWKPNSKNWNMFYLCSGTLYWCFHHNFLT